MDLQTSSRSTATIGVLALVLVLATAWAWHKVTQPFPTSTVAATPICQDTAVAAGERIRPPMVLVNVLNAGTTVGLAQSTQAGLADFGFAAGKRGNTPHVHKSLTAEIWTDGPKGAATQLVASYLGSDVRVVHRYTDYPGITVVVGDAFGKVHRGLPSLRAIADTTVCEPTADY
ncbi:MAG TPA: LytR C-terminal domain-containing protein [Nocardioides sp.]|nr:LytR C-terminal domain-containing protein [Nocardioides sp.]